MKKILILILMSFVLCNQSFAVDTFVDLEKADAELKENVNDFEKKFISNERRDYFDGAAVMTDLGWFYFQGTEGFEQNNERAVFWFKKASKLGFTTSSSNLGLFYYAGVGGMEQNLEKSHVYYVLAAEQFGTSPWLPEAIVREMDKYNPNPTKEFANLRDLFLAAATIGSKTRMNRLRNLADLSQIKNEKITVDDFLNEEEIICEDGYKVKIYVSEVNFFILRFIMPKIEDGLTQDEFLLSYRYAEKIDNQIEWFDYSENEFFGDSLHHYKVYFDQKNQQLRLYAQPYDITGNTKLYLKIYDAYKILKKEKLSDIGGSKHIELEVAFFNNLYNNYKKLKKNTDNSGGSLNENYLCEI